MGEPPADLRRLAIVRADRATKRIDKPLASRMNGFLGQQGSQWHLLMAASTISMVPTVIMVLLLQRHLVRGIAMSGLGGR